MTNKTEDIVEKMHTQRVQELPELWLAASELTDSEEYNLRYALENVIWYLENLEGGRELLREMEKNVRIRISRNVMRKRKLKREAV